MSEDDDHHPTGSGRDVFKDTSIGARRRADETPSELEKRRSKLTAAYTTILEGVWERLRVCVPARPVLI
jgi:hypothetical protein